MTAMQIDAAAVSEVGHVRASNQDALWQQADFWLVADGMGGHAGGEIASQIAIDTIRHVLTDGEGLVAAFDAAHQAILARGDAEPQLAGMGSTAVAVKLQGRTFELAWVGDSRIYHLPAKGELQQLSCDHSFVQDMVLRGVLTLDEAQTHPNKNLINRALGKTTQTLSRADTCELRPSREGLLLLCTDGVSDMLSSAQLKTALTVEGCAAEKAAALKAAVLATAATDNFSFIVLCYRVPSFFQRFFS